MNFCCQHTNYFSKSIVSETVFNLRIKYIVFKSCSSKYIEIFHYYLYLQEELPVRDYIEFPPFKPWIRSPLLLYKHSSQWPKTRRRRAYVPGEEVSVHLQAANIGSASLPPASTQQVKWNQYNHNHSLTTADASFHPITETLSSNSIQS